MFEYKQIKKDELEQVIRNASQKMGINEVMSKITELEEEIHKLK